MRLKALLLLVLLPLTARASITFEFRYGTGSSFWSDSSKAALNSAANTLANYLIAAAPVTLTFDVTGYSTNDGTLASAGSGFLAFSGFNMTIVQSKIQSGIDLNGIGADGVISWNFFHSWGLGDSIAAGQFDFKAVAMHELLHTLGFLSLINSAGNNTNTYWATFDDFVVDSNGDAPISNGTYLWDTSYNTNLTGGNGGLYFGGPNAVAAFGGLVPLYTPSPWAPGSSVAHLDTTYFTGENKQLMNHAVSTGPGIRTLSRIELGILQDLGYMLAEPSFGSAPVPEPSTWLMSLVTAGGVVVVFLRRRKLAKK